MRAFRTTNNFIKLIKTDFMAHPCIYCGGECYCSGDIDDVIVSKTPARCEGCGCEEMLNEDDDELDDDDYPWPDDEDGFEPCANCDLPDACSDFGECAIKAGIRKNYPIDGIF